MKFFYCDHCKEAVEVQFVGPGDDWLWDIMCLQCYGTIARTHGEVANAYTMLCEHYQSAADMGLVERMQSVQMQTVFPDVRMVIGDEDLPEI